jgi:hypothetical protein
MVSFRLFPHQKYRGVNDRPSSCESRLIETKPAV